MYFRQAVPSESGKMAGFKSTLLSKIWAIEIAKGEGRHEQV